MLEAGQFGSLDYKYSTLEISPLDCFVMLRENHFPSAEPTRLRELSQRSKEEETVNAMAQSKALEMVFGYVEHSRVHKSLPVLKTMFDIYQTSVLGSKKTQIIKPVYDRDTASQQTCREWMQALICVKNNTPIPLQDR